MLVLLAAVLCGQAVAFLSVNIGAADFLKTGKPTLVSALRHLHGFPRKPPSVFLRTAPSRMMRPGAVELAPVGQNRFSGFFRVQAAYYLYPHKAYFLRKGSAQSKIERARSLGADYVILFRRKAESWPAVSGVQEIARTGCCRLLELAAP